MIVAVQFSPRKQRALAALFALMLWSQPLSAGAHAEFVEADPAPGSALPSFPNVLRVTFSESVDSGLSSLVLLSSDGSPVPLGALATDPNDSQVLKVSVLNPGSNESGTYTLVWGAYSAEDDHASSGSFTFSVGTGVAPVQDSSSAASAAPAAIVGKWLELIGVILLTGLGIFAATTRSTVSKHPSGRINVFAALAALGLAGAAISLRAREIAVTGGELLGTVNGETIAELLDSTYGQAWLARVLLLLGVLVLALWGGRAGNRAVPPGIALIGLLAIATIAISGHTGAIDLSRAAMAVDFLHMAGAAVWLGGLLGLLLVVEPAFPSIEYGRLLRSQGNRYVAAVALIVVAGAISAWWQIGGRRSLTSSDYGRILLIKLAMVVAILGVAIYNRRVLQGERPRLEWARFAIGLELVLATVVLLFSADLSQTSPANQPLPVDIASRAIELDSSARDGDSTVELSGILAGDPSDWIDVTVAPATDLQRVIVRSSMTDTETGVEIGDRFDAEVVPGRNGVYRFPAGRLGVAGNWQLEITVRRAGVEDDIVTVPIDSSGLAARGRAMESDRWGGFRPTSHTALALGLAVVMLLVGLGGIRRFTGFEPLASGFLLAASLLIAGGFLVSAARSVVPLTPAHGLANRLAPDPATLTYAGELYRMNCAACHGADGTGVGSGNLAHLHGNSANLTRDGAVDQSDGDLRYWISKGVPGTLMPAFSPALTEEERWQLVLYIRQLQEAAKAAAAAGQ